MGNNFTPPTTRNSRFFFGKTACLKNKSTILPTRANRLKMFQQRFAKIANLLIISALQGGGIS